MPEEISATVEIFNGGLWSAQKTRENERGGGDNTVIFYTGSNNKASGAEATDLQTDIKH